MHVKFLFNHYKLHGYTIYLYNKQYCVCSVIGSIASDKTTAIYNIVLKFYVKNNNFVQRLFYLNTGR